MNRPRFLLNLVVFGALLLTVGAAAFCRADTFSSYHIGNSLTNDMGPKWLPGRGAPGYDSVVSGFHIKCSENLTYMLNNPEQTCVTPNEYGFYDEALPGYEWDAVVLQPYVGATGAQELASASAMIGMARQNSANSDTRFYVYSTWPGAPIVNGSPTVDFPATWLATTDNYSRSTSMVHERGWYEWYIGELRDDLPEVSINMIPVGDVVLVLDEKLRSGAYAGLSDASDLYRDPRHFNNVGCYVAMMTTWATLHRTSPLELAWNNGFFASTPGGHSRDFTPTEELSLLIRETVWEVLTQHEYAGVIDPNTLPGDFNGDGKVDAADYTVWRNSLGQEGVGLAADGIQNGVVDKADYLLWKQNYGRVAEGSLVTPPATIPEPHAALLAGLVLACGALWGTFARRRVEIR